jgi:hypothetical protein
MKSIALVKAPNEDLAIIKESKEYATVTGRPGKDWDGRVIIECENGTFALGTGGKAYMYEDGVSKYWKNGVNPNGTNWNVIFTFETITIFDNIETAPSILDLISDINETGTNVNGQPYKPNRNQCNNYINIFGII